MSEDDKIFNPNDPMLVMRSEEMAERIEELEDEVDYLQGVLEIYKKQVDALQKIIYDMKEVNE